MSRSFDGYSRDEYKALINGLLDIIYDNHSTTQQIREYVSSIHRIVIATLVILTLFVVAIIVVACLFACQRYQNGQRPSLYRTKSTPIEI
ncbi:hypothetical protein AB6A40_003357 [Gnathostoma spinigerum]|uniref:Uncharacterized protein n=1 Tax=Gnathostoma spinigerum TaxID=75299 RepID=A0ABD6EI56_9BILA